MEGHIALLTMGYNAKKMLSLAEESRYTTIAIHLLLAAPHLVENAIFASHLRWVFRLMVMGFLSVRMCLL